MPRFALEKVEEIKGKIDFYYLLIDGVNQYETFSEQIEQEGNQSRELVTMQVRMQEMAEMRQPLPDTKCRDITPKKDGVKEYELKTKHLRLYLIHEEKLGRVIVLLGKKTTQKKNIQSFRRLKREYLNQ
jgi:putative component of toxin-antitoxin plasmid stabilization module